MPPYSRKIYKTMCLCRLEGMVKINYRERGKASRRGWGSKRKGVEQLEGEGEEVEEGAIEQE